MRAIRKPDSLGHREHSDTNPRKSDEQRNEEAPSGYHRKATPIDPPPTVRSRRTWSNVEEFEHEGYSYRLQRRPLAEPKDITLAKREEEALALASNGLSRREIADSLGLAPSTIGVLLHRAAQKLGATSRGELIKNYRARKISEPSR